MNWSRHMSRKVEEASTLGLRPGIWPNRVEFEGDLYSYLRMMKDGEGEVTAVLYGTEDGRLLEVLND